MNVVKGSKGSSIAMIAILTATIKMSLFKEFVKQKDAIS